MGKYQDIFRTREAEDGAGKRDSRDFDVWYHNDDVRAMVFQLFGNVRHERREDYYPPFVFFDGMDGRFETLMEVCREELSRSNKRFFPFIIKPEKGGAHYMAGMLRKEADGQITLFLFNPNGYSSPGFAQSRLSLSYSDSVAGMPLILSPHAIQTKEKDGGVLVSCGPLCVAWMEYYVNHPEAADALDTGFVLPPEFISLLSFQAPQYQVFMRVLRAKHDAMLGELSDEDDLVTEFYQPFGAKLFNDEDDGWVPADSDDEYYYPENNDPHHGGSDVLMTVKSLDKDPKNEPLIDTFNLNLARMAKYRAPVMITVAVLIGVETTVGCRFFKLAPTAPSSPSGDAGVMPKPGGV